MQQQYEFVGLYEISTLVKQQATLHVKFLAVLGAAFHAVVFHDGDGAGAHVLHIETKTGDDQEQDGHEG